MENAKSLIFALVVLGGEALRFRMPSLNDITPPPDFEKRRAQDNQCEWLSQALLTVPVPENAVIDWERIHRLADPHTTTWRSHRPNESGGALTPRGHRKRIQVENFQQILRALTITVAATKRGGAAEANRLVAVEFGSGSGNLIIPLAVAFPDYDFVAVDNNPIALSLLDERVNSLQLSNVQTVCCPIIDYDGECDIAISLHACGSASDHSIEVALRKQAPYLISPCCVGKVIGGPKSQWLWSQIDNATFVDIARKADKSEVKEMTSLNRRCKLVVEIDRSQRAVEAGNYTTQLLTLRGLDGYAKSDLLVGLPPAVVQELCSNGIREKHSIEMVLRTSTKSTNKEESFDPKTEDEWREILTDDQFEILRNQGTEPPLYSEETPGQLEFELLQRFNSKYPQKGGFRCVACSAMLYYAKTKFGARCGWPSFYDAADGAIEEHSQDGNGELSSTQINELRCSRCESHLGHVFRGEKFGTPTDARHCVNGLALVYDEDVKQPASLPPLPRYLTLEQIPP